MKSSKILSILSRRDFKNIIIPAVLILSASGALFVIWADSPGKTPSGTNTLETKIPVSNEKKIADAPILETSTAASQSSDTTATETTNTATAPTDTSSRDQTSASTSNSTNTIIPPSTATPWEKCSPVVRDFYTNPNKTVGERVPLVQVELEARSIFVPWGQSAGSLTFNSPDETNVGMVNTNYYGDVRISGGLYSPNVTLTVNDGIAMSSGPKALTITTTCSNYFMPISFTYETPPTINILPASIDAATGIVSYTVDRPISSLALTYGLAECQQPDGLYLCAGTTTVPVTDLSGTFSLDPYFPQIDQYFSLYPPTTIYLTLSPNSSEGLAVGAAGYFVLSP